MVSWPTGPPSALRPFSPVSPADTPADKAGLKVGDAIIAVDGDSIDGALSLVGQVRERSAGDKVTLKILRDGQTQEHDRHSHQQTDHESVTLRTPSAPCPLQR